MIGGGAIMLTLGGRGAVRRRQFSHPSRQNCTPASTLPDPLQRVMSWGRLGTEGIYQAGAVALEHGAFAIHEKG
jgi:hypothetical protein